MEAEEFINSDGGGLNATSIASRIGPLYIEQVSRTSDIADCRANGRALCPLSDDDACSKALEPCTCAALPAVGPR